MTGFFSYKAPAPADDPPPGTRMTREEWEQLSPGYRREITRYHERRERLVIDKETGIAYL